MPIPSQYPLGMTIFTVHWSKDGGSNETHRINSVVAVAKARLCPSSGNLRLVRRFAQLAAVRQHDGMRDRKPETETGCVIHIPCIVTAYKWF